MFVSLRQSTKKHAQFAENWKHQTTRPFHFHHNFPRKTGPRSSRESKERKSRWELEKKGKVCLTAKKAQRRGGEVRNETFGSRLFGVSSLPRLKTPRFSPQNPAHRLRSPHVSPKILRSPSERPTLYLFKLNLSRSKPGRCNMTPLSSTHVRKQHCLIIL